MKSSKEELNISDPIYRDAFSRVTGDVFLGMSSWVGSGLLIYGTVALLVSRQIFGWIESGAALVAGSLFLFLKAKASNRILLERQAENYGLAGFILATIAFGLGVAGDSNLGGEAWQALVWVIAGVAFTNSRYFNVLLGTGAVGWLAVVVTAAGASDAGGSLGEMLIRGAVLGIGAAMGLLLHRAKEKALWHWLPFEVRDRDRDTQLKEAREQAFQLDLRCRQLSQASFEAIIIYERNRIVETNDAVKTLFGYSPQELLGRDFIELVPQAQRAQLEHAAQMGSFAPMETLGLRKTGVIFPVEVAIKALPAQERTLRVAAFRDLSELKTAQDLLRSEKESLERQFRRQAALAELEVVIDDPAQYTVLIEQVVTVACTQLPASAAAFFSVEDEGRRLELRSGNLRSFPNETALSLGPETPYAVRGMLETADAIMSSELGQDPMGIRTLFPGEEIEAFMVVPFLVEGGMAGVVFVMRSEPRKFQPEDLSFVTMLNARVASALTKVELFERLRQANTLLEQQHAELQESNEALSIAKDAAEASSRAKSQFLDTMSHELRTPLNGIMGMISLLEFSELNEDQAENLRTMKESSDSLLRQITDVLTFTQLDGGRLELSIGPIVAPLLMQAVVDQCRPMAIAKKLTLTSQVSPGATKAMEADGTRIQEVLTRLVDNAVKFTDTGTVTLRATHAVDRHGRTVMRFDVLDTGPGVDPDQQATLFQPFKQVDGGMNRRHGGMGLGLAICHRLVSLMGGEIGVQSEPGRGSMFWFSVPVSA